MTAAEHRQNCHDIIRSHRPHRTWWTLWLHQRCDCGLPWIVRNRIAGCWVVRGAVAELAGIPTSHSYTRDWWER